MHSASKLSIIAAAASLLAALPAFGEGSTTVTFGDPVVSSGLTSISVRQPYELTGDGEITGVALSIGNAEGSLSPSDVTPVFADGVASFELNDLPNYTTYYWKLTFTIDDEGVVSEQSDTEIRSAKIKRIATLNPGATSFASESSWNINAIPNDRYTDVHIDGADGESSAVSLASAENMELGAVEVDTGDSFAVSKNVKANVTYIWDKINNNGTFDLSAAANKQNATTTTLRLENNGVAIVNGPNALLRVNGHSTDKNRTGVRLNVAGGVENYGTMVFGQTIHDRDNLEVNLLNPCVFVNDGRVEIKAEGTGSHGSSYSLLKFSTGVANSYCSILGTGTIVLDDPRDATLAGYVKITSSTRTLTVTNGCGHTIIGVGSIDTFGLVNAGTVVATGQNRSLSIVNSKIETYHGAAMENIATGKIISDSPKGLYLGPGGTAPAQFLNSGLLEARTGCYIYINDSLTHVRVQLAKSVPDTYELSGRWAGGGTIRVPRTVALDANSVIAPGDIALVERGGGVIYGEGESTCGTLTITSNLVMNAETVCEFQFVKPGVSDALHVGGTVKVDGTLKIVGQPRGGTYRMITSDNPITSENANFFAAIDTSAAGSGVRPRFTSGSVTETIQVETGETDPETGNPVTEQVEKTTYYLDVSFSGGTAVYLR